MKSVYFVMVSWAALGKESRKERKLCIWGFQGTRELAMPLGVSGSEITQICSPPKLKGKKKTKALKNP